MKTTQISIATIATITEAARVCRIGAGFPTKHTGYTGDVIFWASHVTTGVGADLLRCLAMLGLSRGEWCVVDGASRQADLSDLDGEIRGSVLLCDDGHASATLCSMLSRPLACIGV